LEWIRVAANPHSENDMTDLDRDMPEILAQASDLFDRPDRMEIVLEAFRIASRGYKGPPDSLIIGVSDDKRGCRLCNAADHGDTDAAAILAKVPRPRVKVATSEEMATATVYRET
jgi:hypothetical protein